MNEATNDAPTLNPLPRAIWYATAPAIGWPAPFVLKWSSSSTKSSETRLEKKCPGVMSVLWVRYPAWLQYHMPCTVSAASSSTSVSVSGCFTAGGASEVSSSGTVGGASAADAVRASATKTATALTTILRESQAKPHTSRVHR